MSGRSITLALTWMLCSLCWGQVAAAAEFTATGLKCHGCVDSSDIRDNAVNSRRIKNGSVKEQDTVPAANPARVESFFIEEIYWSEGHKNLPYRTLVEWELELPRTGYVAWVANWSFLSSDDTRIACLIEIPYYKREIANSYVRVKTEAGKYIPASAFGVAEVIRLPDGSRKRTLQLRIGCTGGYQDDDAGITKYIKDLSVIIYHLPEYYGVEASN